MARLNGPSRAQLLQQVEQLRDEVEELRAQNAELSKTMRAQLEVMRMDCAVSDRESARESGENIKLRARVAEAVEALERAAAFMGICHDVVILYADQDGVFDTKQVLREAFENAREALAQIKKPAAFTRKVEDGHRAAPTAGGTFDCPAGFLDPDCSDCSGSDPGEGDGADRLEKRDENEVP
jgi:cell division septum initiation protein DivIVA